MIIQKIKRFLALLLIFTLSTLQTIAYSYDKLIVSYDANSSFNTSIIQLSNLDNEEIKDLSNTYNFSDGSKTIVNIKGLNINRSKLDFITNYKGLFSFAVNDSKYSLSKEKNDNSPKQVFLLTAQTSGKNNLKEKISNDLTLLDYLVYDKTTEMSLFGAFNLSNKPALPYGLRAPPYYILTLI